MLGLSFLPGRWRHQSREGIALGAAHGVKVWNAFGFCCLQEIEPVAAHCQRFLHAEPRRWVPGRLFVPMAKSTGIFVDAAVDTLWIWRKTRDRSAAVRQPGGISTSCASGRRL